MFKVDHNFHSSINTPTVDTQTPLLGCNEHVQKCKSKTDGNFQWPSILFFFGVVQEVRRWPLVRPKLRPEQRTGRTWHVRPSAMSKTENTPGGKHITESGPTSARLAQG